MKQNSVLYCCLMLVLATLSNTAQGTQNASTSRVIDDPAYTRPQRMVEIEPGRRLNLFCTGSGSPTVVFDSSLVAPTSEWGLVQPAISKATRACSYDRAGVGFSDASRRPGSSENIVDDLRRLLVAASIEPPYVLVGHSYGGMNIKLYAYKHPTEVAGLVFVDPSHENQREEWRIKIDPRKLSRADNEKLKLEPALARIRQCIAAVPEGFTAGTPLYAQCIGDPDSRLGAEINAAHRKLYSQVAYHQANLSEEDSVFRVSAEQLRAARRNLGALPLIVLTSDTRGPNGTEPLPPIDPAYKLYMELHDDIASISSLGVNRIVRRSAHNVHTDRPDAVIDAISEVVWAARVRAQAMGSELQVK